MKTLSLAMEGVEEAHALASSTGKDAMSELVNMTHLSKGPHLTYELGHSGPNSNKYSEGGNRNASLPTPSPGFTQPLSPPVPCASLQPHPFLLLHRHHRVLFVLRGDSEVVRPTETDGGENQCFGIWV